MKAMMKEMQRAFWPSLFGLALAATLAVPGVYAQTYYNTEAGNGIGTLQSNWYDSASGQYLANGGNGGWWHAANAITTLSSYEAAVGDNSYYSVLSNTFTNAQTGSTGHANFENMYFDDMGWWALAWIDAYDVTANSSYLSMAETIANYMYQNGWDTTQCGGGMWWSTAKTYKNAIANELFLTVAAKLANRTAGSTASKYLGWANAEWSWFNGSGMINASNFINDGLTLGTPCTNNNGPVWTYNQGVILGGLVELAQAANDPALMAEAQTLANAVLNSYGASTPLVDANGILTEEQMPSGNTDVPQFKGIFARNLAALNNAAPVPAYMAFLDANAGSIWTNDQTSTGYEFGVYWQGPVDAEDPIRQSSALDAIVGAVQTQGRNAVGSISTTAFGSMQAYAGDGSGNVWVNWQQRGKGSLIAPANWQSNWSEFTMNGVHSTGTPAVSADGIGRQWIFIPTSTDIYYLAEGNTGGGWGGWTDMGTSSNGLGALYALYSSNGGQYVFGSKSGTVYYSSKANPNAPWSTFSGLSGLSETTYSVAVNTQTGYVEVFAIDSSGKLWTNTQTDLSSWSGWTSSGLTGEAFQGYVTAVSNSEAGMQVLGIDIGNSAVWTKYQSSPGGSWNGWMSLGNVGGGVTIQPGFICSKNANGNLQVFGVGTDGNLYTKYQTSPSSWSSSWTKLGSVSGQPLYSYLVANNSADGRILVMGVSKTSPYNIYGIWESYPNTYTAWNGWSTWGGAGLRFYGNQL